MDRKEIIVYPNIIFKSLTRNMLLENFCGRVYNGDCDLKFRGKNDVEASRNTSKINEFN